MGLTHFGQSGLSIGIELPLDNDWTAAGQRKQQQDGRPFGVPDMTAHQRLITLADTLGFKAAWVRDVPLYDPQFGDAAQVFETFSYLGYLSAITKNILLGTAAVVLPLRQPWLVKKAANTVAQLSNNRFILGVASGDRPSEYPLFGVDYQQRGALFRDAMSIIQDPAAQLTQGQQLLPHADPYPVFVAGLAQQTPAWIGQNLDGWLAYPGTPDDHIKRVSLWRSVAGNKPYVSFIHLDLLQHHEAPLTRHRFGVKTGIKGLLRELNAMQAAGVNHIGLHFRRNERNLADTLQDIAQHILPVFHQ